MQIYFFCGAWETRDNRAIAAKNSHRALYPDELIPLLFYYFNICLLSTFSSTVICWMAILLSL